MKSLFLLRGLPGAGKTTLAKSILGDDRNHWEADMFFIHPLTGDYIFEPTKLRSAHQWCQENVEADMRGGFEKIVVSNTFTQEWEMAAYYEMAAKHGYIVFSLIVENRHGGENEHGVPADKLQAMKDRFEVKL